MPIDYSRYQPNWPEIREQVRARSGDRCETCGLANGQMVWSVVVQTANGLRRVWCWGLGQLLHIARISPDPDSTKKVRVVLTVAHMDHDPER